MTQEEKDLLLKDLSARLPYKVKVCDDMKRIYTLTLGNSYLVDLFYSNGDYVDVPIKPYLRPLSSMKEEEKDYVVKHSLGYTANIGGGKKDEKLYFHFKAESFDWLNKKMFDFRGLIPKGLALSTEVFNPYTD